MFLKYDILLRADIRYVCDDYYIREKRSAQRGVKISDIGSRVQRVDQLDDFPVL